MKKTYYERADVIVKGDEVCPEKVWLICIDAEKGWKTGSSKSYYVYMAGAKNRKIEGSILEIRYIISEDDTMAISKIYQKSWQYAYKGIIPQSYLDAISEGKWASIIDSPGWNTLILLENEKIIGTSSFCK